MKVWLVIERDYDWQTIHAAYTSEQLANEHALVAGFSVEAVEVSDSLADEYRDTPQKQHGRAANEAESRRRYELQQQRDEETVERRQAFNPAEHVANGGGISLCHCRTFSTDSYFVNTHGHCAYCGGTIPEVFRKLKGEKAMQEEIDKLAEHQRIKMRELTGEKQNA